jgi:CRISPR/Cas system CSM-associated protein Csm4 (group 5 of RAMP superfamily)
MLQEIESRKSQKSYDEQVTELHGDFNIQDQFDATYETRKTSPIFEYCREQLYAEFPVEDFLPKEKYPKKKKGKKAKKAQWSPKSEFDTAFVPSRKLGDEHIITD